MSSETKSGGTKEPPEQDSPRSWVVPPYSPNPRMITYWEERGKSHDGEKRGRWVEWWRRWFT